MMNLYIETQIRELGKDYDDYNEFVVLWEQHLHEHIETLLIFVKDKGIRLDKVKKVLKETIDDILDEYHEIEKYHEL